MSDSDVCNVLCSVALQIQPVASFMESIHPHHSLPSTFPALLPFSLPASSFPRHEMRWGYETCGSPTAREGRAG